MRKSTAVLNKLVFDGKSKHWPFDRHISKMRECNDDLALAGAPVPIPIQVQKLCDSFQLQALSHITTTINATPDYRNSFERAVAFMKTELTSLMVKNGSTATRNISSVQTMDGDAADGSTDKSSNNNSDQSRKALVEKLKRQLKQARTKFNKKF